ncbi:MAG: nitrogen fixation protein NifQ [Bacteroidota bacterium]|nr:nitrogen fixation protein NifQ [Bacteroidota bacterium]
MATVKEGKSKTTTNHEKIREWAEEREGKPAIVKGTEGGKEDGALLRINFPGFAEKNLKNISWDKFFEIFDSRNLQFLYQEKSTAGEESRFFKFINKEED